MKDKILVALIPDRLKGQRYSEMCLEAIKHASKQRRATEFFAQAITYYNDRYYCKGTICNTHILYPLRVLDGIRRENKIYSLNQFRKILKEKGGEELRVSLDYGPRIHIFLDPDKHEDACNIISSFKTSSKRTNYIINSVNAYLMDNPTKESKIWLHTCQRELELLAKRYLDTKDEAFISNIWNAMCMYEGTYNASYVAEEPATYLAKLL